MPGRIIFLFSIRVVALKDVFPNRIQFYGKGLSDDKTGKTVVITAPNSVK
jgi:hypothetical protein